MSKPIRFIITRTSTSSGGDPDCPNAVAIPFVKTERYYGSEPLTDTKPAWWYNNSHCRNYREVGGVQCRDYRGVRWEIEFPDADAFLAFVATSGDEFIISKRDVPEAVSCEPKPPEFSLEIYDDYRE